MARLIKIIGILQMAVIYGAIAAFIVPWAQERWRIEQAGRAHLRQRVARRELFDLGGMGLLEWRVAHASGCPPDAAAIARHMGRVDTVDPWSTPYRMHCIDGGHRSVAYFVIFSAGPDGIAGTPDDIHRENENHDCLCE